MTQEALKLAEIIEHFDSNDESLPLELLKEISATLRALAQTQEPVGVVHHKLTSTLGADYEQVAVFYRPVEQGTKLYTAVTTPPQRTWVGLTDEDIQVVAKQARSKDHAVTLTNKLLREKNT
jgi:hypothetical protein